VAPIAGIHLALNDQHIYTISGSLNRMNPAVVQIDRSSGAASEVPQSVGAWWVAADATTVYWTNPTELWKLSAGGSPLKLASLNALHLMPMPVDGNVFYGVCDLSNTNAVTGKRILMVSAAGGGTPITIAQYPPDVPADTCSPTYFALDAQYVYFNTSTYGIDKVARSGTGQPSVVLPDRPEWVGRIAIDETNVYWTNERDTVFAATLSTGTTRALAFLPSPYGLALDTNYVYVIETNAGRLVRVLKDGGCPEIIAASEDRLEDVVLDGNTAFWNVALQPGSIRSLTIP